MKNIVHEGRNLTPINTPLHILSVQQYTYKHAYTRIVTEKIKRKTVQRNNSYCKPEVGQVYERRNFRS